MTSRLSRPTARRAFAPERAVQTGFTLIEVMVALVLMAIVSLVSWQGLDSVVRVRDHVEREAASDQAALNAIGQLTTDIRMRAADHVFYGTSANEGRSRQPTLPYATTVQGRVGDAVLDVVRSPASGEPGWQTVRWWREQGRLMRALAPVGREWPLPVPGPGTAVLDNVNAFEIQAYIPGRGWQPPPWPGNANTATGLTFVIALATPQGGSPQVYRRRVDLP